nr:hypothetical protein [Desulfoscipio gibsoniae]
MAVRDAQWMGPIYILLGLKAAFIKFLSLLLLT